MKQHGIMPDTPEDDPEDDVPEDDREPDDFEPPYNDFIVQDWQDAGVDW